MAPLTDTMGVVMPESEAPTEARLRAYGDFLFLAFRSDWHQRMTMANLRSAFEAPIALDQYRIFRFDGVPRGLITWARMSAEAERKYVAGELLDPEDWQSGDRLWLIDMIAPYKGLAASITRWVMVPGQFTDATFSFRRVSADHATRRIVTIDLTRPDDKARVLSEADFLGGGR
ncbi:toxin-activating lysine-acyltransferase [Pseudosulfitobacter sp. DSM 107133]|jgi:cytolysin-activating lysine-acyltransferase|uniref:toxin-activating lysine-acyltransferase n=1 Tax=Pseudosulfitobacter sp. DSM 107133 TaxID=2883100 RepID=UPI000DF473A2|nr:toxin-activating lysine-acyltransferase [Pseudosulfitobacter sp. DSM 107133]UOA26413.1 Cyclolysin-activating lysine-acyltransferase CyaC [Pseudosulfitobacter sp. DSM 107133]